MHVSSNVISILTQPSCFWYIAYSNNRRRTNPGLFIHSKCYNLKTPNILYNISLYVVCFINSWCQNLSAFVGTRYQRKTTTKHIPTFQLHALLIDTIHMHIMVNTKMHEHRNFQIMVLFNYYVEAYLFH